MNRPTVQVTLAGQTQRCYLSVTAYSEPLDPIRLMVSLKVAGDASAPPTVISANLPYEPAPAGSRQFYFKVEHEGLLEQLTAAGAIQLVNEQPISGDKSGSKAFLAEITWPDVFIDVQIPSLEELQRAAKDWEKFFAHPCAMHLGM